MKYPDLISVSFVCNKCDPTTCTTTITINRLAEEKSPTNEIRSTCPMYSSRDGYAQFKKVK
jgi:hypothetical protein